MCGIVGFVDIGFDDPKELLESMLQSIYHRGPDSFGVLHENGVSLGMRRLSIIDVAGGDQPIYSDDERYAIIYNGEVYNYAALRERLEKKGVRFKTNSDTETILYTYIHFGLECVNMLRGMFAFCIYDRKNRTLFIARDPSGIKQLYYTRIGNGLLFASELKAVLKCPKVSARPNLSAIDDYLTFRYVPGPQTIIEDIYALPAGSYGIWDSGRFSFQKYWSPPAGQTLDMSKDEIQCRFDELFDESVRIRTISERPVGAFLSGGLDSSAIVASLSRQSSFPVNTFSIGFNWSGDELPLAKQTASDLGCLHNEITCRIEDTAALPNIVWHMDSPMGDGIILPTYLLAKFASEQVTVVLSGEGADEIAGGYFMHKVFHWLAKAQWALPYLGNSNLLKKVIEKTPAHALNVLFDHPAALGEDGKKRLLELLKLVGSKDTRSIYHYLITLFNRADKEKLYAPAMLNSVQQSKGHVVSPPLSEFNSLLNLQFEHWLPSNVLQRLDTLTMAHSLEGRVPFLDRELIEFALRTPHSCKYAYGKNKRLVREYLKKNYPPISKRKKVPFYIPIDKYLQSGPLHEMSRELLSRTSIERRGLFNADHVEGLIKAVHDGNSLVGKQVFSLLVLELWFRMYIDNDMSWNVG